MQSSPIYLRVLQYTHGREPTEFYKRAWLIANYVQKAFISQTLHTIVAV